MELQVAIDSIRADAEKWSTVAGRLYDKSLEVNRLTLTKAQLSFASEMDDMIGRYRETLIEVRRLLDNGNYQLSALGSTLRDVARSYESTDDAARAHLVGVWEPAE